MELTAKQKTVILENKEVFSQIIRYEEENKEKREEMNIGMFWDYGDVCTDGQTLYQLYREKLLTLPFGASGRRKSYALVDLPTIKSFLLGHETEQTKMKITELNKSANVDLEHLFDNIIGYDDIKQVIKLALLSEKPVHILLEGPPASAKSLFLMDLEKLENSRFILTGLATKAGIRDVLIESPKYVLLDEVDKVEDPGDLTALLSLMSEGRIVIAKNNNYTVINTLTWVFGACNSLRGIKPELLSRFMHLKLPKYEEEQYKTIVRQLLVNEEGTQQEVANYIAEKVALYSKDVRDAIRVARLSKTKQDVDTIIKISGKYV